MVKNKEIENIVKDELNSDDYFIVGIQNKQDTIKVIVDGYKGIDLDKCGEITKKLRSSLGEKVDDYNIEVTSPGLTSAFQVTDQYKKNIGQKVETLLKTGEKITGKLQEVNPDNILIEEKKRIKTDKNKKKTVREEKTIKFDDIKYTKLIISFKN